MRLTVIHDADGNISSIAASPAEGPVLALATAPGERMSEVDAPELSPDQGDKYVTEQLAGMIKNQRVDVTSAKSRLTPR